MDLILKWKTVLAIVIIIRNNKFIENAIESMLNALAPCDLVTSWT